MKPSLTKNNPYAPYLLLLIQPIFMATNTIVARGGVEFVPPISLAFWRWFTVFIILFPFFFNEILKYKIKNNGFIYLTETLVILKNKKFRIGEYPTIFINRKFGNSSLKLNEIINSLLGIFKIKFRKI